MSQKFQKAAIAPVNQARPRRADGGCEMASSCLECPFPACMKEEVGGGKRWLKARRDASIAEMRESSGMSIAELGRRFSVSRRTVYRALQKNKRIFHDSLTPVNL